MEIKPLSAIINFDPDADNYRMDGAIYVNSSIPSSKFNFIAWDCYEDVYPSGSGYRIPKDSRPNLSLYDIVYDGSLFQSPRIGYISSSDSNYWYATTISNTAIYRLFLRSTSDRTFSTNLVEYSGTSWSSIPFDQMLGITAYEKWNQRTTPRYLYLIFRWPENVSVNQQLLVGTVSWDCELDKINIDAVGLGNQMLMVDWANSGADYDRWSDSSVNYYARYTIYMDDDPEYVINNPIWEYESSIDEMVYNYKRWMNNVLNYTSGTNKYILKHPDEMTLKTTISYDPANPRQSTGGFSVGNVTPSGTPFTGAIYLLLGSITNGAGQYKICTGGRTWYIPSVWTTLSKNNYLACKLNSATANSHYVYVDSQGQWYIDNIPQGIPLQHL